MWLSGVVETQEPSLKLFNKGSNRGIFGIEQENLLACDYGLYVLQIYHYCSLSTQHRRRVREKRVEDAKVSGGQTSPPHDRVLASFHHLGLAGGVQEEPRSDPSALLSDSGSTPYADWAVGSSRIRVFFGRGETRLGWNGRRVPHHASHHSHSATAPCPFCLGVVALFPCSFSFSF